MDKPYLNISDLLDYFRQNVDMRWTEHRQKSNFAKIHSRFDITCQNVNVSLQKEVLNMKFSIGVKGMPEYGLSNDEIVRDPQVRDWFNGLEEVLLYMDENSWSLEADLKDLGIENEEFSIIKKED